MIFLYNSESLRIFALSKKQMIMKVTVEFDVKWDGYEDVCDELIVEDMFSNWPGKDGVEIKDYKVEH